MTNYPKCIAESIVDIIIDDIRGRKVLGDELDNVDDDVFESMKDEWKEIIINVLSIYDIS